MTWVIGEKKIQSVNARIFSASMQHCYRALQLYTNDDDSLYFKNIQLTVDRLFKTVELIATFFNHEKATRFLRIHQSDFLAVTRDVEAGEKSLMIKLSFSDLNVFLFNLNHVFASFNLDISNDVLDQMSAFLIEELPIKNFVSAADKKDVNRTVVPFR